MRSIRHPLSGALYDLEPHGAIRVTVRDGKSGLFRPAGTKSTLSADEIARADRFYLNAIGEVL
jgi:hypothetical protein